MNPKAKVTLPAAYSQPDAPAAKSRTKLDGGSFDKGQSVKVLNIGRQQIGTATIACLQQKNTVNGKPVGKNCVTIQHLEAFQRFSNYKMSYDAEGRWYVNQLGYDNIVKWPRHLIARYKYMLLLHVYARD